MVKSDEIKALMGSVKFHIHLRIYFDKEVGRDDSHASDCLEGNAGLAASCFYHLFALPGLQY